jgi:hypothetical protein
MIANTTDVNPVEADYCLYILSRIPIVGFVSLVSRYWSRNTTASMRLPLGSFRRFFRIVFVAFGCIHALGLEFVRANLIAGLAFMGVAGLAHVKVGAHNSL